MEKVDAVTLAAMQAGDENADFEESRARFQQMLVEPLPQRYAGADMAESELRVAVGLSA